MLRRRIASVLCSAVVLGLSAGAARGADFDTARAANDFSDLLAFIAAGPLTPADRDRVAAETQEQYATNADYVQSGDAKVQKLLAGIAKAPAWEKAYTREALRFQMELDAQSDPTREIVERIDPVVVIDRGHKRLMTEATLTAWQQACDWMAGVLSVAAPQADFKADERAYLKANFAGLRDAKADQVAHVERNYPMMRLVLEHADPRKRADFIRQARPLALDQKQFGLRLSEAMSQTYNLAIHEAIVHESIVHAGILNAGLQYNMLYRGMYNHP